MASGSKTCCHLMAYKESFYLCSTLYKSIRRKLSKLFKSTIKHFWFRGTQSEHDFDHTSYHTNPKLKFLSFLVISPDVFFIFHNTPSFKPHIHNFRKCTNEHIISPAKFFKTRKASMHLSLYSLSVSLASSDRAGGHFES